jgi:hypothetical protein
MTTLALDTRPESHYTADVDPREIVRYEKK